MRLICLILCAMKLEAKPFLKALENPKTESGALYRAYCGKIAGANVVVAISGVGADRAAAAVESLLGSYDISRVIMSGTAGGIDRKLKIGDSVVSEELLFHDSNGDLLLPAVADASGTVYKADEVLLDTLRIAIEKDPPDHTVYFGRITTGKTFVTSKSRNIINREFRPLCSDMETAAVAKAVALKGIPFIAVRSISDSAEKSGMAAFVRYASLASEHSFIVVKKLLAAKARK